MKRTIAAWLLAAGVVAGALLGVSTARAAEPAPALPAGPITDCLSGGRVWLVVVTDTGATRASICVGRPSTGLQALSTVGYSNAPGGYVCTVAGYPSTCPTTFANQYWSYWYATPGGQWTYSPLGAGGRRPPAGTLEGWCYTANASAAAQRSTCQSQLSSKVNPATLVVPTAPATTKAPTTKAPTTKAPTTMAPTKAPTTKATTRMTSVRPPTLAPRPTRSMITKAPATAPAPVSSGPARPTTAAPTAEATSASGSSPSSASSTSTTTPTPGLSGATSASDSPSSGEDEVVAPPVANTPEPGSPAGVITTVGVLALGGSAAGIYLWKGRRP
ncbi:hypothetical protein [Aestuariimicrobium ganziense]|uniref:hypothetical protein n=1 Tax=Aestuariimicrobium ganziense TaxID=2773677 RepID=UPI001942D804|nr:hypothetical protein [Aestuariimicrobium ganziense]